MIRLLLLAYPRAWRRRYGAELEQLIDDAGLTPRAALDVLRSGIHERASPVATHLEGGSIMSIGPAWRHPRAAALTALLLMLPTLVFVVGSVLAYQLRVEGLTPAMEAVTGWLGNVGPVEILFAAAPAVALLVAMAPLVRVDTQRNGDRMAFVGIRLRAANLVVAVLALAVGLALVWYAVGESMIGRY